jgi:hypothetical protein
MLNSLVKESVKNKNYPDIIFVKSVGDSDFNQTYFLFSGFNFLFLA